MCYEIRKADTSKGEIGMNGITNGTTKKKRYPREKVFIVNESYAGKKNLSDIFADLLYSAYCKREPEISGKENNPSGYMPTHTGHDNYTGV